MLLLLTADIVALEPVLRETHFVHTVAGSGNGGKAQMCFLWQSPRLFVHFLENNGSLLS